MKNRLLSLARRYGLLAVWLAIQAPAGAANPIEIGLSAYWTFDGTLYDVAHAVGSPSSTVADNGIFTGEPNVGFTDDARLGSGALEVNQGASWVTVPKSADTIGNIATRNITVSVWVQAESLGINWQTAFAQGEGSYWRVLHSDHYPATLAYYAGGGGPNVLYSTTTYEPPTELVHLVGVTEHGAGSFLYINGELEAFGDGPALDVNLAGAPNLFIGANPGRAGLGWDGKIDDAAIWTRPLSAEEVAQIYAAGVAGKSLGDLLELPISEADTAITITEQPQSRTIAIGDSTTLNARAASFLPLAYQWQKEVGGTFVNVADGGSITGATQAILTISNAQAADTGNYRMLVSNARHSATSQPASVVVTAVANLIASGLSAYWTFDGTLDDIAHARGSGFSTTADNGSFTGAPDVGFTTDAVLGAGALTLNGGSGWVTVPKSQSIRLAMWPRAASPFPCGCKLTILILTGRALCPTGKAPTGASSVSGKTTLSNSSGLAARRKRFLLPSSRRRPNECIWWG